MGEIPKEYAPIFSELVRRQMEWWRRYYVGVDAILAPSTLNMLNTFSDPLLGSPQGMAFVKAHGLLQPSPFPLIVPKVSLYSYLYGKGLLIPPAPPVSSDDWWQLLAMARSTPRFYAPGFKLNLPTQPL
jgi:hypothetical protein